MFRSLLVAAVISGALLSARPAEARRWETLTSAKWKIQFSVPRGMAKADWSQGRWGGFKGTIGDTTIALLGYRGTTSFREILQFIIRATGIPARYWTRVGKGDNWHGFARYKTYKVSHGGETLVAGLLRHANRRIHYTVFIKAPDRTWRAQAAAMEKFADSIRALP